jgi:hypothetical protein
MWVTESKIMKNVLVIDIGGTQPGMAGLGRMGATMERRLVLWLNL